MHPRHHEYMAACDYPGRLDPAAVENHLRDYLSALGVNREVVRIRRGWSTATDQHLCDYLVQIARDAIDARAARAARAARGGRPARAARAARDARAARAARDARAAIDAIDAIDA